MKELNKIFLIVFCLFVVNCTRRQNSNILVKEYCIIDTINATGNLIDSKWFEHEYNPILYLGNLTDTIIIDHFLHFAPVPPPDPSWDIFGIASEDVRIEEKYDTIKYNEYLAIYEQEVEAYPLTKYLFNFDSIQNLGSIYRDTTQIKVDTNYTISKMADHDFILRQNKLYEAYPIIITNQGSDTLQIGYQRHLSLTVEALDSLGNWSKIADSYGIHGLPLPDSHMLLPGLSVITSTFKTTGEYKTKLRIKIGNNISNEWSGKINYNQFNSKFDDKGEYKTEYIEQQKNKTTKR